MSESSVDSLSDKESHEEYIDSLSDRENNEEHGIETQYYVSNISTIVDCNSNPSLTEDLQKLIVEKNVTHSIANELLAILRKHGHVGLPKDMKVLLQTPRNVYANIKSVGSGHYIHFGIFRTLKRSIQIYSQFIKGNEIK